MPDAHVQASILRAYPAARHERYAVPLVRSTLKIFSPIGVADAQREVRADIEVHKFLAAPNMGYTPAHKTKTAVIGGYGFGSYRLKIGFLPQTAPCFTGLRLGRLKALNLRDIRWDCDGHDQPFFKKDFLHFRAIVQNHMCQPTTVVVPLLSLKLQFHRLALDQGAQPIARGDCERFVRLAVFTEFRGVDADQSNLALVGENHTVAIQDMANDIACVISSGRTAGQEQRDDEDRRTASLR